MYDYNAITMARHQMEGWTTQSISKETAKLVEELADLITAMEKRFTKCSKHEAVYKAVADMVQRLKKRSQR